MMRWTVDLEKESFVGIVKIFAFKGGQMCGTECLWIHARGLVRGAQVHPGHGRLKMKPASGV
jgi:hypothetical protein